MRHDAVEEAAVVGIPDDEWGERIAAVVVVRDGHEVTGDELRELREAPSAVVEGSRRGRIPAALPYTDTGKLLRRTVRAEFLGEA